MSNIDKPPHEKIASEKAQTAPPQASIEQAAREARLAENLRANLRRRKTASRKSKTQEN